MAMNQEFGGFGCGFAPKLAPLLDEVDDRIRKGRRMIARSRHNAEDVVAAAALLVRRYPVATLAVAAGTFAAAGGVLGFMFGFGTGRHMRRE